MTTFGVRLAAVGSIALLCAAAVVGCTTGGGDAPASGFPPRPVSVPANRIPPCSMFSPEQAKELALSRSMLGTANVDGLESPVCVWRGVEVDINTQFIPIAASTAAGLPGATVVQINGFGAVQNIPDVAGPPICQIAVDVADNQTIRVQASFIPDHPSDDADLCRRAADATSKVMTTVVALTPR